VDINPTDAVCLRTSATIVAFFDSEGMPINVPKRHEHMAVTMVIATTIQIGIPRFIHDDAFSIIARPPYYDGLVDI
jgi:hypothetical protein